MTAASPDLPSVPEDVRRDFEAYKDSVEVAETGFVSDGLSREQCDRRVKVLVDGMKAAESKLLFSISAALARGAAAVAILEDCDHQLVNEWEDSIGRDMFLRDQKVVPKNWPHSPRCPRCAWDRAKAATATKETPRD